MEQEVPELKIFVAHFIRQKHVYVPEILNFQMSEIFYGWLCKLEIELRYSIIYIVNIILQKKLIMHYFKL